MVATAQCSSLLHLLRLLHLLHCRYSLLHLLQQSVVVYCIYNIVATAECSSLLHLLHRRYISGDLRRRPAPTHSITFALIRMVI